MTFQLTTSVAPADLLISAHKIVEEAHIYRAPLANPQA